MNNSNAIDWCGCHWDCKMEGGRIIHTNSPWCWYSTDVIKRTGINSLELSIRENPKDVKYWDGNTYHPKYEAATMRSIESFGFGTFSCEIKLPKGNNLFPSFWLVGYGNWPPEIDICEAWSGKNNYYKFPLSMRITTNVHYNNEQMKHEHIKSENVWIFETKNPSDNFIKYECEWLPDSITFKINGKVVRKVTDHVCEKVVKNIKNKEFGNKMNVVFNVWMENPDEYDVSMKTPMVIRNFKYDEYKQ